MSAKKATAETGGKDATDGKLEGLTSTDLHLIIMGFQCHDLGKIDIEKFAAVAGYDNQKSARVRWNFVRRKMEKYFSENKKGDAELATLPDKAPTTGARAAAKRKQASANADAANADPEGAGAGAGTPAPKKRRAAKAAHTKTESNEADEGDKEHDVHNNFNKDAPEETIGEIGMKKEPADYGNATMDDMQTGGFVAAMEPMNPEERNA